MPRILLSLLLLCIAAGCHKQAPSTQPVPVRTVLAKALHGTEGLRYSAEVTPFTQVDAAFRTDGYIAEIGERSALGEMRILQPGDRVRKGEVLARVRDQPYRDRVIEAGANLSKAQAALRKANLDFKRASALIATESITAPEYDAAREEYETAQAAVTGAKARLDQARLKLEDTRLRSPLGGILLQRNIELGSLVHADSVAFVVADTSRVKVLFSVPDVVLGDIELGSVLSLRTESLPKREFRGQVSEIAPLADQRTRVFAITVTVPNGDGLLKTGMVMSLDLEKLRLPGARVVVPLSCLIADPTKKGGFAVFVVEEEAEQLRARLRPVAPGQVLGNSVAIRQGLAAGERVVDTGAAQLKDGQAVSIVP